MGRIAGIALALALAGCNQLLGIDDVTGAEDPERDSDGDGEIDFEDNCPLVANPDQANADADAHGDACDRCPDSGADRDGDGLQDGSVPGCDLCPDRANPSNHDEDGDAIGDACDACPAVAGMPADGDGDGVGDACDPGPGPHMPVVFDAFAPFVPSDPRWTATTPWLPTADGDGVAPAAKPTGLGDGLLGTFDLGVRSSWLVTAGAILPAGLLDASLGIAMVDPATGKHLHRCLIECRAGTCVLADAAMQSAQTLAAGAYRLELGGYQKFTEFRVVCRAFGPTNDETPEHAVTQAVARPALVTTEITDFTHAFAVQ